MGDHQEETSMRIALNDNETVDQDDVEGHGWGTNDNETVERLATNDNETVERLATNDNETVD
jgi:hypothetical protein